jgi:hypothetical protein
MVAEEIGVRREKKKKKEKENFWFFPLEIALNGRNRSLADDAEEKKEGDDAAQTHGPSCA